MTERTFRPYEVVFRIALDDTYEVFLKWFVRRYDDEVRLLHSKMEWSKSGANFAPLRSGALTTGRVEQSVLHSRTPAERERALPVLQEAPLRKSGAGEDQKVKLKNELFEVRLEISELAKDIASIDGVLAPVWAAERDAREAIMRTHGRDPADRIVFLQGGAPRRVGPFRELLAVAEQWGPTKSERRELVTRMKAYERLAERLAKMLKGEPRKGAAA